MHLEFLIEDSSGKRLLEAIMPKILGPHARPHTWKLHAYRGVGRIPRGMTANADPAKRMLLDQLPRLLRGYSKTPGIDAVVVVLDTDRRDCVGFLAELRTMARDCAAEHLTLFRLAIEEIESWYLGDRRAIQVAYPKVRAQALREYVQDSVCDTWELLAEAIHPGGLRAVQRPGGPRPGDLKHEWAERIGQQLDPDVNLSPSFQKFRDGIRGRVTAPPPSTPEA